MMIDVHMKDGRTVFRLRKRGLLVDLIKRKVIRRRAEGLANAVGSLWLPYGPV